MPVPVVIRTTRYLCPSCRRGHSKQAAAVAHIARCWHNPEARACKTCAHYLPAESEPEVGYSSPEGCADGVDLAAGLVANCARWAANEDHASKEQP